MAKQGKRREHTATTSAAKKTISFLILIAVVAFVLRLIAAFGVNGMPIGRTPNLDAFEYLSRARRIASGNFTWPQAPAHAPLYPFALGAMLFATGGSLIAARAIQAAIGALTCVVTAMTGMRFFGDRAGYGAGILLAVYGPLIWIDVSFLAEGLLVFFLAVTLWCVATNRHPALTGAILGLAALTRPTALIFLPLILIAAAHTWRARTAMLLATIAVITPVTIANWRTSHAFLPIQAYGGLNFYLGNSPARDGIASARLGGDWEKIAPEAARHGILTPLGEDRFFLKKTRTEILDHPAAYALLLLRKAVWAFQNEEIRDSDSFYFYRQFVPLLRWLPVFAILFGIAAAGMVFADWRTAAPRIVAAYIALSALTCVLLVVGSRYRIPMVIGCALFGGVIFQATGKRRALIATAVGLLAAGCSLAWRYPPTHDFAEEWAFTAKSLAIEGDFAASEQAARQAVAADPKNALGWDQLGRALATRGYAIEAGDAFQHAVAINPDFSDARADAGKLAEQSNDLNRAAAQYAQAAQSDPRNSIAWGHLAEIEMRRQNPAAAAAAYGHLLALEPGNPDALFGLARVEGSLGKPAEALSLVSRARAVREPEGEEWFLIALLSLQANQYDKCEDALAHAAESLPDDPRVPFTKALLRFQQGRYADADSILIDLQRRYPDFRAAALLRQRIATMRH